MFLDRYRAPSARVEDRDSGELVERPLGLLAIALIVPLALVFAAAIVMNSMPGYAATFNQVGLTLAWPTRFALHSTWAWWTLAGLGAWRALVVLLTPQASPARYRALRRAELLLIAASALLGGVVFYGIAKPLSQLATVV